MLSLLFRRALARTTPLARQGHSFLTRELSASAPHTSAPSIPALIAAAQAASPLKDAFKFYGISTSPSPVPATNPSDPLVTNLAPEHTFLWSFRDVHTHIRALANGMSNAGLGPLDKIVAFMPAGTQEYVSLILAAAELGATVVAVQPPASSTGVDVAPIRTALNEYQASALFLWHGYRTNGSDDSIFTTGENSIVSALLPSLAADDSRGKFAFQRVTALPLKSEEFPALKYVVHTGDAHVRGAICFKSLMLYNEGTSAAGGSSNDIVLIEASTGKQVTHGELLLGAKDLGSKLGLSALSTEKTGKLVVPADPTSSAATAIVSAIMHETLMISPGLFNEHVKASTTADAEHALLM